eukprot:2295871-Alexandrium_andersonii.AAC.1
MGGHLSSVQLLVVSGVRCVSGCSLCPGRSRPVRMGTHANVQPKGAVYPVFVVSGCVRPQTRQPPKLRCRTPEAPRSA